MNTLKWLWGVVFAIIGFKVFGLFMASPNHASSEMNSLVGMIFIFAILSGVIIKGLCTSFRTYQHIVGHRLGFHDQTEQ